MPVWGWCFSSTLHGTVKRRFSAEGYMYYLFCTLWQNPDREIWQNVDLDLLWACALRNVLYPKEFNFLTFSFYIPKVVLYNAKNELLNKIFQIFMSHFKLKYCIRRKGNRCWRYKVTITPNWSLTVVINIDLMTLIPKWRVNVSQNFSVRNISDILAVVST